MARSMVAQVTELQEMTPEQLRVKWEALYNDKPPITISRQQMIGRLAYRLQELVFGGLSAELRHTIETVTTEQSKKTGSQPIPGTRFVRKWQGATYEVTALDTGFSYNGKTYRSLTAIATEITGTKWNGRDFFGLKQLAESARKGGK